MQTEIMSAASLGDHLKPSVAPSGGGGRDGLGTGSRLQAPPEDEEEDEGIQSDEEELEDVEETLTERLAGLTEMVPARVWALTGRTFSFSYWLLRRSAWVLGTSLALLFLPPFIEQQRLEFEEMQNMQKKQMMLGQGAAMPSRPITLPPPPPGPH